jgi:hypothetical protein
MKTRQDAFWAASATALLILAGCAPRTLWVGEPPTASIDNEYFNANLSPTCKSSGCDSFYLSIHSKTNKNIEVNWNKTLFISRGQTSGGFMFEGVVYKDRNNPKPPDIVFGKSRFAKSIWPNNLVHFSSGRYGGWENSPMPPGENGIYLSVIVDGKEINERLTMRLEPRPLQ